MKIRANTAVMLIIAAVATSTITLGQNQNPTVVPPYANPYGASYDEWGARWLQWIFSIPAVAPTGLPNPQFSDGAVDCGYRQPSHEGTDRVWFLAGRICLDPACKNTITTAHRSCTIPDDKALFFPLLNSWADDTDNPPDHFTAQELADLIAPGLDGAILHASIDGVPVSNLSAYRAPRAGFEMTLPRVDNLYQLLGEDVPGTFWPNTNIKPVAQDGYYLMVNPLPAGNHTINFGGELLNGFQIDITYDIFVTGNHHK